MKKIALLILAAVLFTGCAQVRPVDWEALSGSRSDATITLSYSYNPDKVIPKASDSQALGVAKLRCSAWGYSSAVSFGGTGKRCDENAISFWTWMPYCKTMLVTRTYQCLGQGDGAAPKFD